jgi:hypothetical protein
MLIAECSPAIQPFNQRYGRPSGAALLPLWLSSDLCADRSKRRAA